MGHVVVFGSPPGVPPDQQVAGDESQGHRGEREDPRQAERANQHVRHRRFLCRRADDLDDERLRVLGLEHASSLTRYRPVTAAVVVTFLSDVWYLRTASASAWAMRCR